MRFWKKSSAVLLALALLQAQLQPLHAASVRAVEAPTASVLALPVSRSWKTLPAYAYGQFSALQISGVQPEALRRMLDASGLSPQALAGLSVEKQLCAVRGVVDSAIQAALSPAPALQDSAEAAQAADHIRRLRDLRAVLPILGADRAASLTSALEEGQDSWRKRMSRAGARLMEDKLKALVAGQVKTWNGRTADVPLPDGSVLSFKWHPYLGSARDEGQRMELAFGLGIDSPIPLPQADGSYGADYRGPDDFLPKAARESTPEGDFGYDTYLAYLKPPALAKPYEGYLNDKLPGRVPAPEKARVLESATLKAVDDMLVLSRNGYAHSSLMAISHHGAHWEWDFWRWNHPVLGGLRFGPSFINGWKKAFAYPNLRLSGLADFEHIERWQTIAKEHEHPDHGGMVYHDAYSAGMGQNLTELSLVLLQSGAVNGLPHEQVARIIEKAFQRYVTGLLPESAEAELDSAALRSALARSSRRLSFVNRYWKTGVLSLAAATLLPLAAAARAAAPTLNAPATSQTALWPMLAFASIFVIGFMGSFIGLQKTPGNLPGWALQPLIMDGVKPVVEVLRRHAREIGPRAADHPSGSAWRGPQAILLAADLIAGLLIPAFLFAVGAEVIATALGLTGLAVSSSWPIWSAVAGAALMPARLLLRLPGWLSRRGQGPINPGS